MKKTNTQKGITLIALIITIIVLLILAVVTIGAVQESKMIEYAENAAMDYNAKQKEEERVLAKYETLLDEQQGIGPWKVQEDGTIKNGKTGEIKEIGDTFTTEEVLKELGIEATEYKGTYSKTWSLLSVENGKLKLVSTTNVAYGLSLGYNDPGAIDAVPAVNESSPTKEEMLKRSIWSYNHAMDTIKIAVETATKGIAGVRSLTMEDIEAKEVLNITDEQKRTLSQYYGQIERFYYKGDAETGRVYNQNLEWNEIDTEAEDTTEEGWSNETKGSTNVFISHDKVIDGTDENKANVVKLKDNYYYYYSAFTDTKFKDLLGNTNSFIASYCVRTGYADNKVVFGLRTLANESISYSTLFDSYGNRIYEQCWSSCYSLYIKADI